MADGGEMCVVSITGYAIWYTAPEPLERGLGSLPAPTSRPPPPRPPVERGTRVDKNTIDYRLTVSDPQTFSQAWTLANSVWRTDEEIYEAGCHERNIGLAAILAGARAQEKK